ncbi:Domain of unknown function (DUF4419)-containing protein [uncultured virus]|nr:Domain of unknown function (DUF4419)-containing protein [uncultured virus]
MTSHIDFVFTNTTNKPNPNKEDIDPTPQPIKPSNWVITILWELIRNDRGTTGAQAAADIKIVNSLTSDHFSLSNDSIISLKSSYSHQGLMQTVFIAWANECKFQLSPDMLFYTIISEIASQIRQHAQEYKSIFTSNSSNDKTIADINANLSIEAVIKRLESLIVNVDLLNVITKTPFTTAPSHFNQVTGISLANIASPYYEYRSTKCGIPQLRLAGTDDDWIKLQQSIDKLIEIFPMLQDYLTRVVDVVKSITIARQAHDTAFFANMFTYYKNPGCMSGHEPVVTDGWLKQFYYKPRDTIASYPSHINCLPYICKDASVESDDRYCVYVTSLTSSVVDSDGFMIPQYSIVHLEILHDDAKRLYEILAY